MYKPSSFDIYLIGKPKVEGLNCTLETFHMISCNWSNPIVLSGFNITYYKISVETANNTVATTTALNYSCNVSTYGEYRIDIVPYIEELEGETTYIMLDIDKGNTITLILNNNLWLSCL